MDLSKHPLPIDDSSECLLIISHACFIRLSFLENDLFAQILNEFILLIISLGDLWFKTCIVYASPVSQMLSISKLLMVKHVAESLTATLEFEGTA